jgi:probable F420-dependent oxidoreductase
VWSFDSHILWEEPYVIYSQILANTSRVIVGPMVTNPGSRDVTVTASTFATLNDLFGNRTICGIGRGDSARRTLGLPPIDLAELRSSVSLIRDLASGRPGNYRGVEVRLPWVTDSRLEVWVAAYGPKALALTGEVADGFILQLADVDIAEWMIREVRAAAARAGRDPAAVKFCVAAPAYVGTDLAHMRDQTRWFGGMVGNHVADIVRRYGDTGAIPTALSDYIRGRTGYDYAQHGRAGNTHASFVPDEIVDRFCVLGPPDAHIERMLKLRQLGVDQFAVYLQHDDKAGTLAAYRDEVIPALTC